MSRSVYLRGFDQDMAKLIVDYMRDHGTAFLDRFVSGALRYLSRVAGIVTCHSILRRCTPTRVERVPDSERLRVSYTDAQGAACVDEFDTVMLAVGALRAHHRRPRF